MALKRPVVYMGFGKELDAANIVSLKRHYLPLGKVGGKPAWLNPVNLPSNNLITCKQCKKVMPMLIQIYCSGESENSFHRYLYVFMCSNNECQKVWLSHIICSLMVFFFRFVKVITFVFYVANLLAKMIFIILKKS